MGSFEVEERCVALFHGVGRARQRRCWVVRRRTDGARRRARHRLLIQAEVMG
jgi:hypothetical protein